MTKQNRFEAHTNADLAGQCRMQARDNLDPEYSQFMDAVALRLIGGVPTPDGDVAFQSRVMAWALACFGQAISTDRVERCDRFVEEALELTQSLGWTADRAHALVDYVFSRPVGEPTQEAGGVMVTLGALCEVAGVDMQAAGEIELTRVWSKIDVIRAKQATKPTGSALPIAIPQVNS